MKLTALRLHNVRRFAGRGIRVEDIGDGVNVLCAANEFGKSTCFDALHALFFQPHTGTPGAVQALRPYSGGSPMVEADIVTPGGAFTLSKRYYAGKRAQIRERGSGRVVAQADEAERFIASLVRGGTGGPAGLLWVRQGMTGIERRAKSEDEQDRRARETVLTSVQGEVEALTGGRRMQAAIAACEEELAPLVTATGRPRTGGPWATAIEERDRLAESERSLAAEVEHLRAALERRRSIRAELAEIGDPERERERRLELSAAETALAEARSRSDALAAATSRESLAKNRLLSAEEALRAFDDLLARHAALLADEASAAKGRDAARARQGALGAAGRDLARATEEVEREMGEARALLVRLDDALRAREAAERLDALRATLAQARTAREELDRDEAAARRLSVPAAALAELDKVERELDRAEALAAASAPRLRVDYEPGAVPGVAIGQHVLQDGEDRALIDGTIEVAGIGRLTLTLPGSPGAAALQGLRQRRSGLLEGLGVDSLAAAKLRETRAREAERALALSRQRLALLAPDGLPALDAQLARLAERATPPQSSPDPVDPAAVREGLDAAEARFRALRGELAVHQARVAAVTEEVLEAERALAGSSAARGAIADRLGPEPERPARREELAAAAAAAQAESAAASAQREALAARAGDLSAAEARRDRLVSAARAADQAVALLREEAASLDGRIQTRAEEAIEESWQEIRDRLAEAERRVAALGREVALLTRLRAALEEARNEARDHYFAPVMRELRPLLGLLFPEASVTFDEETLLPRSVMRDGLEEEVGVLSGGMREQLAILTRLAFARLLAQDGQTAPVILDDALVYSDDDRIEKMFDALHRQASGQQIIVLSCRQRAFQRLGGTVLRMQDWQPAD